MPEYPLLWCSFSTQKVPEDQVQLFRSLGDSTTLSWALPQATCSQSRRQCPWCQACPALMQHTDRASPTAVASGVAGETRRRPTGEAHSNWQAVSMSPRESSPAASSKYTGAQRRGPELPSWKFCAQLKSTKCNWGCEPDFPPDLRGWGHAVSISASRSLTPRVSSIFSLFQQVLS